MEIFACSPTRYDFEHPRKLPAIPGTEVKTGESLSTTEHALALIECVRQA